MDIGTAIVMSTAIVALAIVTLGYFSYQSTLTAIRYGQERVATKGIAVIGKLAPSLKLPPLPPPPDPPSQP